MVEFVTLFLGLVTGPVTVEVAVTEEVAGVELRLDGRSVAELSGEPWRVDLELGSELRPHRLTAVARDARGREIDREIQYLNLPRGRVEVSLLVEHGASGRPESVRVSWESRGGAALAGLRVRLDDVELEVADPERISLPPLDPSTLHLLEAELVFEDGWTMRERLALGGRFVDEASALLTALPWEPPAGASGEPAPESIEARGGGDEPLRIVTVERGETDIVFVRDRWAREALTRLFTVSRSVATLPGNRAALARRVVEALPLEADERLRVLYPEPLAGRGQLLEYDLFPVTPPIDSTTGGGLYWHLTTDVRVEDTHPRRLADAVAAAANQAAAGNRRRAVVLVLAPSSRDEESRFDARQVSEYLRAMAVPLHVWFLGKAKNADETWGEALPIRTLKDLEKALEQLRREVGRQRIVWVEGLHLPDEVTIGPLPATAPAPSGS